MPSLHDLQMSWKAYVFSTDHESILTEISGDFARERMDIYVDAYGARLLEAMQKIFPMLEKVMGEEQFFETASQYLDAYPSTYYSIAKIGINFGVYLKEKNTLFSNMADLEWSISCAVDAQDGKPLSPQDLQNIPQHDWENIIFELHPSLQLLEFSTPVLEIYKAAFSGKGLKKKLQARPAENQISYCRVYRKGMQVFYQSMDSLEYFFLTCIQKKKRFAEVCEKISAQKDQEDAATYALSKIIQWMGDEVLIGAKV